ncbi:MAG: hypothetical protein ACLFWD_08520 [Anaerolineales bacterium]
MGSSERNSQLEDALRRLGDNLVALGQTAWESPEGRRIRDDIGKGLKQAEDGFQRATDRFKQSETGQRLEEDLHRIKYGLESGKLENNARSEIASLIERLNQNLEGWLEDSGESNVPWGRS